MESVDPADRRIYRRVPLEISMEVSHLHDEELHSDSLVVSCRGRDVSGGGVSFYGPTRYQNQSLLRLRIHLCSKPSESLESAKVLKVMGTVKWSKKDTEAKNFVTGVQFLNIYEDDFNILNEYVQNLLID